MLTYLGALARTRIRSELGSSAVEYGLLVAGVALGLFAVLKVMEVTLGQVFQNTTDHLND